MTAHELLAELRALDVHVQADGGRLKVSAPKGRMTPALEAALVAGKADLLRVLQGDGQRGAELPALVPVRRDAGALPLSFLQERLWLVDRLQPGGTGYNLASLLLPDSPLDAARAAEAVRRVVARHEILRSRFVLDGEAPAVRIGAASDVRVDVRDLRAWSDAARLELLTGAAKAAAHEPFDLALEAPIRFTVLRLTDDRSALLISAHHIALDSWSFAILAQELTREYEAVGRAAPPAPAPTLQYVDFASWQRLTMALPSAASRLAYWQRKLAGLPQLSTFQPDHARALDGEGTGAALEYRWPPELYEAARAVARRLDATLYMVLLAAVTAVLHRHTGQTDLAIGSPVGTRERAELEEMIGPILNPLVLRFDLADDPTFAELVARAREAVLDGHSNQEVPFERVVQELRPERSLGAAPLFQVAVVLHNAPNASAATLVGGGSIYDLTWFATEYAGTLTGSIEYRADLYEHSTVERIADHLARLLAAAATDPSSRVSELPMLGADEERRVMVEFNQTAVDVDGASVVEQFARTAAARPDATAVVAGDGTYSYAELDRLAGAVAARLRIAGVGRGSFVALAMDRGRALPAAALGILATGAAYVPVDASYPADRVALMLADSGARHVVTTSTLAATLAAAAVGAETIVVDELRPCESDGMRSPTDLPPDDVAYLMYTSGSTGTPKGVLVTHGGVSNLLGAMRERIGFTPSDSIVAVTTPSFDISVLELFLPLVQGGCTILATREQASDGALLARLVDESRATMLQSTPSGWRLLMNAGWGGNAALTAIAGGEPMPADLAAWLAPRSSRVVNGYGPTETTVYSTAAILAPGDAITIGTPVANTRVYVLDAHRRPVPIGAPGELYIAGAGVARGYHARPELTAERFVADLAAPGRTMYRTGDVARWRADGRLEHLGRVDGQIKVRGYRIETGEIESALASHPLVRTAVVGVQLAAADDPRLVAWVLLEEDEQVTASELRRHLRRTLPEFMIPSMIVELETLPLTPNGKVDRRALPDAFAGHHPTRADFVPPATPTEQMIAGIWTRLLKVERVGTTDTFFDLGGHSLLAMRAATEIGARTGGAIDPRLMFFRTLGQLAAACDATRAGSGTAGRL